LQHGRLHREDGTAIINNDGTLYWYENGICLDSYYPNFGCYQEKLTTKNKALRRLNRKKAPRPYSYDMYMKDITEKFG